MKKLSLFVCLLSAGLTIWSCGKVKEAANVAEGLKN